MYVCMCGCVGVWVYVCMHVWVYVCMCGCVGVCIYVCDVCLCLKVISRIFYCVNRSWSGRIVLAELRRSNLLQVPSSHARCHILTFLWEITDIIFLRCKSRCCAFLLFGVFAVFFTLCHLNQLFNTSNNNNTVDDESMCISGYNFKINIYTFDWMVGRRWYDLSDFLFMWVHCLLSLVDKSVKKR